MRKKYRLNLTDDEHSLIINSLLVWKNSLISEGKYTDVIDELLIEVIQAPVKKFRLK